LFNEVVLCVIRAFAARSASRGVTTFFFPQKKSLGDAMVFLQGWKYAPQSITGFWPFFPHPPQFRHEYAFHGF